MNYLQEYTDLAIQMRCYDESYYDSCNSTISDYEYNMMKQRIEQLEREVLYELSTRV